MKNSTQKPKKIPMRQCLGCNEHRPKREMIRVVRTPSGEIILDFVGKASGRGAYICPEPKCFAKARKSGRISSALQCEISNSIYDSLEKCIQEKNGG